LVAGSRGPEAAAPEKRPVSKPRSETEPFDPRWNIRRARRNSASVVRRRAVYRFAIFDPQGAGGRVFSRISLFAAML